MAMSKKREGVDGLKSTTGGKRRDDRQVIGRTYFDPLTIDAKNALTVIYLLKSPEDNVMLRAVASLEVFGRKDPENFKLLCSLGIFEYVLPLINHTDYIVKRFTLKLIGMLCALEEFRDQMLRVDNILEILSDLLRKEADAVLQEFAALTLAELTKDCQAASDLLRVDRCVEMLFEKICSPDPDIEKNCLEIMTHLLNDLRGIDNFVSSPGFDIRLLLNLITSSYPTIQALVIEILKQLTSMCRNPDAVHAFRDAGGVDETLGVLQKKECSDLHEGALDLLLNIVECPELCNYLQASACLDQLVALLDNTENINTMRKILGILARMSQTRTGGMALTLVEMDERFVDFLSVVEGDDDEIIQIQACLGVANMAQYSQAAKRMMNRNPVDTLTEIIMNRAKNINLRNMAAYALSMLGRADKRVSQSLVDTGAYRDLLPILIENTQFPTELCQNIMHIFIEIAQYDDLREELLNESFISALMNCLPRSKKSTINVALQVDALECLSEFMVDADARSIFSHLGGTSLVMSCLSSKVASVREWAGHLTVLLSQSADFIKAFIQRGGLQWMLREKNTMYSMPSWQSAIETIFNNFLPAKFAFTGRLDFQDITEDVFYIFTNPRSKFCIIEELFKLQVSPIAPVYLANFSQSIPIAIAKDSTSASKVSDASSSVGSHRTGRERRVTIGESEKPASNLISYASVDYGRHTHVMDEPCVNFEKSSPDPYLKTYLETLKKRIIKDENLMGDIGWTFLHPQLIAKRVRLISDFVVNELSGPEADLSCTSPYKDAHLKEMKFFLGTNIIPLGAIRMGSYLERAMLFKVLADRVGFPCALVRGPYGRAWIEIAVPVMNVEDIEDINLTDKGSFSDHDSESKGESGEVDDSISASQRSSLTEAFSVQNDLYSKDEYWYSKIKPEEFRSFPRQFLKPNAIVDLVTHPGRILDINSLEADEYRGNFLCKYNAKPDYLF